jgi:hypothetical protein
VAAFPNAKPDQSDKNKKICTIKLSIKKHEYNLIAESVDHRNEWIMAIRNRNTIKVSHKQKRLTLELDKIDKKAPVTLEAAHKDKVATLLQQQLAERQKLQSKLVLHIDTNMDDKPTKHSEDESDHSERGMITESEGTSDANMSEIDDTSPASELDKLQQTIEEHERKLKERRGQKMQEEKKEPALPSPIPSQNGSPMNNRRSSQLLASPQPQPPSSPLTRGRSASLVVASPTTSPVPERTRSERSFSAASNLEKPKLDCTYIEIYRTCSGDERVFVDEIVLDL